MYWWFPFSKDFLPHSKGLFLYTYDSISMKDFLSFQNPSASSSNMYLLFLRLRKCHLKIRGSLTHPNFECVLIVRFNSASKNVFQNARVLRTRKRLAERPKENPKMKKKSKTKKRQKQVSRAFFHRDRNKDRSLWFFQAFDLKGLFTRPISSCDFALS